MPIRIAEQILKLYFNFHVSAAERSRPRVGRCIATIVRQGVECEVEPAEIPYDDAVDPLRLGHTAIGDQLIELPGAEAQVGGRLFAS